MGKVGRVVVKAVPAVRAGRHAKVVKVAVVRADGMVATWGTTYGTPPADLTNAVMVAAGAGHVLAVRNDGTVTAWGLTNATANSVPTGLAGVKAVAAGWYHNVALLTNDTVSAWGSSLFGQLNIPGAHASRTKQEGRG